MGCFGDGGIMCVTRSETDCSCVGKRLKCGVLPVDMRGAEGAGKATNQSLGMAAAGCVCP